MNIRMTSKFVKNKIRDIISRLELEVGINPFKVMRGSCMAYCWNRGVFFNAKILNNLYKNSFKEEMSFGDFVTAFTLHELGHHLDDKLEKRFEEKSKIHELWRDTEVPSGFKKTPFGLALQNQKTAKLVLEEHELEMEIENIAWDIAKDLNNKFNFISPENLEKVKRFGLGTYQESYDRVLNEFQKIG